MFCIDSSVFINSWTKYYPRDVFPSVWDCYYDLMLTGEAVIPHAMYEEVQKGEDELIQWLDWYRKDSVLRPDERHIRACKAIVQAYPRLLETKKNRSGSGADPWLIACAQVVGGIVVTDETATNNIAKPKIPDVCRAAGIEVIGIAELLRRAGHGNK